MRDLDARLLALGLGIGKQSRSRYSFGPKLVFVLGILVGYTLSRIMTLIAC